MQINIGDKVRYLNETGGGIVTRLLDANTVMVLNEEDEFEIPTLKKNLVVIESAGGTSQPKRESNFPQSNSLVSKQSSAKPLFVEKEDVYMAFVPKEGYAVTDSPMELYLINDTKQVLLYGFFDEIEGKLQGRTAGNLDPNSKIMIREYERQELHELSTCTFQILFYQQGDFQIKKPLEKNIKIQAVKFHKDSSFQETAYFHENVILYKLSTSAIDQQMEDLSQKEIKQIIREKEASDTGRKPQNKQNLSSAILEVDLHINALIDSVTGLSNADILEYQLNKFHEIMREYQQEKGKKIVFIHGIGNGTLKKKLHDELHRKYRKHYQQDASFKEYGWGATMVTIR
ncbi:DUF2027 domain-containing protein [Ancylomarina longa]|uniref:DUF2027 domain-containing protein n=1 Tax=Ancylomarina longa TaxID=2487017 RepID=A0A434AZU3_9BACT|nr:DUF2027 domain-containing protein [Ancylomarina longa]RUT80138.1 DUF2027 domain-containing protein [Ancylomarina longa]